MTAFRRLSPRLLCVFALLLLFATPGDAGKRRRPKKKRGRPPKIEMPKKTSRAITPKQRTTSSKRGRSRNWWRRLLGVPPRNPVRFGPKRNRHDIVSELRAKQRWERWQAIWWARLHGIPIRIETKTVLMELIAVENGKPVYNQTTNVDAAISTAADQVRNMPPFNVDGSGWTVGIWDGGWARPTHQEFGGRVNALGSGSVHYHATHVAGTIGGTGYSGYENARGMAPAVTIDSYDWGLDASQMMARGMSYPGESGAIMLSNHSYGRTCGWVRDGGGNWYFYGDWAADVEPQFGQYGSDYARLWDGIAYSLPYYLVFKSAGNDRNDVGPTDGETVYYWNGSWQPITYDSAQHADGDSDYAGGFDTMNPRSCAKNILTVGAVNDANASAGGARDTSQATMTSFSSWGPTDDGRIKPDLVANGVELYSADSGHDADYRILSGTSMSTPNACGSAVLLVDYFEDRFPGQAMRASTLKALLIHTADDLGNPGPDYKNGWGLMNTKAAADVVKAYADNPSSQLLTEGRLTSANSSDTYRILWNGKDPIRVTLCWTDPPGAAANEHNNSDPKLVNDLDLQLTAPDGSVLSPFVLDPANPNNAATAGENNRDNVEQVLVSSPSPGVYTITVDYDGTLADGEQWYSLILTGGAQRVAPLLPGITEVIPHRGSGVMSMTICGRNFLTGAQARLTREGQTPIELTGEQVGSETIIGQLDLTGAAIGPWNVEVTNPDGRKAVMAGGFIVETAPGSAYATLPFVEDFETFPHAAYWRAFGSNDGRITWYQGLEPHAGVQHVILDDEFDDQTYSQAGIELTVYTAGWSNLVLRFYHKHFNDEPHPMSASYTTNEYSDGVSVSVDQITWYRVQDLSAGTADWSKYEINLSQLLAAQGILRPAKIYLRFQQYDNYPVEADGFAFDDISIDGDPRIVYVKHDATGSNDGSSWTNAFTSLQDALAVATFLDEVWIARGSYFPDTASPGDRNKRFQILSNMQIYGGFAGTETQRSQRDWVANPTYLNGNIGDPSSKFDNSYHVIYATSATNAIIDGVTIMNGHASGGNFESRAAGAALVTSDLHFRNCRFVGNHADHGGAAVTICSSPSAVATFTNCLFLDNSTSLASPGGTVEVAIDQPVVFNNCTFARNSAKGAEAIVNTDTVAVVVRNCILWDSPGVDEVSGNVTIANTCIRQTGYGGSNGNTENDPLFNRPTAFGGIWDVGSDYGDYGIPRTSPCRDAADAVTATAKDLLGYPRDRNPDMGAYEYQKRPLNVVLVDDSAVGANDGSTWEDAFNDLQDAIATAAAHADITEIWIAAGTYKPDGASPGDRTLSYLLIPGVAIYGGFAGIENQRSQRDWKTNIADLNGDLADDDGDNLNPDSTRRKNNSLHVIDATGADATAILDGVTVSHGNASVGPFPNHTGGGLWCVNVSPTVRNVTFYRNTAWNSGGAVSCVNGGSATIEDCTFNENFAQWGGGGLSVVDATPVIRRCRFIKNNTAGDGGGLRLANLSAPLTVVNGVFLNNSADDDGGGIYTYLGSNNATIINCSFSRNSADTGGGIACENSHPTITNCVLWYNAAVTSGPEIYSFMGAAPTISYNCIDHVALDGVDNNFRKRPHYADPDSDLHIRNNSPCIDRANSSGAPADDADGNSRDAKPDVGAYEKTPLLTRDIIYVKQDAVGNNDGTSWADAFNDLQDALAVAVVDSEIWIAGGSYRPDGASPDDRSLSFDLPEGAKLYGGFAGTETSRSQRDWPKNPTTLTGDIGEPGSYSDNSYHVVTMTGQGAGGGKVSTVVPGNYEVVYQLLQLMDGQYLGVGQVTNADSDVMLVRYTKSGIPDTGFGTNGIVTMNTGSGFWENIYAATLDEDGRIIVAGGRSGGGNSEIFIARFHANGQLDTTFAAGGFVTLSGGNGQWAEAVTTDNDGRIVVAGRRNGSNNDVIVARFLVNGELDMSFNGSGFRVQDIAGYNDQAYAVEIDSNDRIVVAGYAENASGRDVLAMRLLDDGSLDTSFDTDGIVTDDLGGGWDVARDLAIDAAGRLVITGDGQFGGNTDLFVLRLDTAGVRDNSFDTDGLVSLDINGHWDSGSQVRIDGNGSIVVFVNSDSGPSQYDFTVVRYTHAGVLDPSFNGTGIAQVDFAADSDEAWSGLIDDQGRLVTAGSAYAGDYAVGLTRHLADGTLDAEFGRSAPCRVDGLIVERGNGVGGATVPHGGGILLDAARLVVRNAMIRSNRAGQYGGGIHGDNGSTVDLENCLFYENVAQSYAGVDIDLESSSAVLNSCTLASYLAAVSTPSQIRCQNSTTGINIRNSILYPDIGSSMVQVIVTVNAPVFVNYSCVRAWAGPGTGNITVYPQYNPELRLGATSPCIGQADPATAADKDLDKHARDSDPDMGAYEYLPLAPAGIIYVKKSATGANNGTSWTDAYVDLQSALAAAVAGTNEIWVAADSYKPDNASPGDRSLTFTLKAGVGVYGGFIGTYETQRSHRRWLENITILTGDLNGDDDTTGNAENSYHVVTGAGTDATTTLNGFTVERGNADGAGTNEMRGAGLANFGTSPLIQSCTFRYCTAEEGGAVNNTGGIVVRDCVFLENRATDHGGGAIYNENAVLTLERCRFEKNSAVGMSSGPAVGGGAIYTYNAPITAVDCAFVENRVEIHDTGVPDDDAFRAPGGAIQSYGNSGPAGDMVIRRCTFARNRAGRGGAAVSYRRKAVFDKCEFAANAVTGLGGALDLRSPAEVENSRFVGNTADRYNGAYGNGGAVSVASFTSAPAVMDFDNCTFTCNRAERYGSTVFAYLNAPLTAVRLRNIISWSNPDIGSPPVHQRGAGTLPGTYVDVSYSNLEIAPAGLVTGVNNISADPQFVAAADPGADGTWGTVDDNYGDQHLQSSSPSIDTGDPNDPLADDLDGNPRNAMPDQGCYEAQFAGSKIIYVDIDAAGDNDGTSWTDAFNDLQDALAAANAHDQIWIAEGDYKPDGADPGNRGLAFNLKDRVFVYGGFQGNETSLDDRDPVTYTVNLSGDIGVQGDATDNSYHVVNAGVLTEIPFLDGVTVRDGRADGAAADGNGGGLYNAAASGVFRRVTFIDNFAWTSGGGVHLGGGNTKLLDCRFVNNYSDTIGGGLGNMGGNATVRRCRFDGNRSYLGGGACDWDGAVTSYINAVFENNTADIIGGGAILGYNATGYIINCTLAGNSTTGVGGAIDSIASTYYVRNSICWGNTADITNELHAGNGSTFDVTNSCINVTTPYPGIDNINDDPFLQADKSLGAGSPAINTGGPGPDIPREDYRNYARDASPDMGAYEYGGVAPTSVTAPLALSTDCAAADACP